jgi:hypothetical protein
MWLEDNLLLRVSTWFCLLGEDILRMEERIEQRENYVCPNPDYLNHGDALVPSLPNLYLPWETHLMVAKFVVKLVPLLFLLIQRFSESLMLCLRSETWHMPHLSLPMVPSLDVLKQKMKIFLGI